VTLERDRHRHGAYGAAPGSPRSKKSDLIAHKRVRRGEACQRETNPDSKSQSRIGRAEISNHHKRPAQGNARSQNAERTSPRITRVRGRPRSNPAARHSLLLPAWVFLPDPPRRGPEQAEKAENAPAFVAFARELRQALLGESAAGGEVIQ
jgi:hypothetical protein